MILVTILYKKQSRTSLASNATKKRMKRAFASGFIIWSDVFRLIYLSTKDMPQFSYWNHLDLISLQY